MNMARQSGRRFNYETATNRNVLARLPFPRFARGLGWCKCHNRFLVERGTEVPTIDRQAAQATANHIADFELPGDFAHEDASEYPS